MNKFLYCLMSIILMFVCVNANAQQKVKVDDGIYLVTYGDVTVIENDNTQQSIQIKVVKSESMYDILCGDTVVKSVVKSGLREGIAYAVQSYTAIPNWVSRPVIDRIVNKIYDSICNYYK